MVASVQHHLQAFADIWNEPTWDHLKAALRAKKIHGFVDLRPLKREERWNSATLANHLGLEPEDLKALKAHVVEVYRLFWPKDQFEAKKDMETLRKFVKAVVDVYPVFVIHRDFAGLRLIANVVVPAKGRTPRIPARPINPLKLVHSLNDRALEAWKAQVEVDKIQNAPRSSYRPSAAPISNGQKENNQDSSSPPPLIDRTRSLSRKRPGDAIDPGTPAKRARAEKQADRLLFSPSKYNEA